MRTSAGTAWSAGQFSRWGPPTGIARERETSVFWHTTNLQDWHVSELAQRGIAFSAYRPGPYSNREDQLWQIDRLILERLGEA